MQKHSELIGTSPVCDHELHVSVSLCTGAYPDRALGHALLVERAASLPAVDGVLHFPAKLPRGGPLLVKTLDVLHSSVGGGQVVGTYADGGQIAHVWR